MFFASSLLSIIVLNYLVDPFSIFNTNKVEGFNKYKPESDRRQRLSKSYIVEKKCPENLIMGNSRALAISETYKAWASSNTYNYALSSASMYEVYRYFQHATSNCNIKTVLLSLDVLLFEKGKDISGQFKEERLSVTKQGKETKNRFKAYLQDSIPALLSTTAFKASLKTIRKQKETITKTFSCSLAQKNHQRILNKGGHFNFINKENRGLFKLLSNINSSRQMQLSLGYFSQFLQHAYVSNIRVILFFSPSHASFYETIYASGYQEKYKKWKREVVKINEKLSLSTNSKKYKLYDFSGYNSITEEEIPSPKHPEKGMKWFWESIHYKEELSYHILDRVFNNIRENCPTPKDFGKKINIANIDKFEESQKNRRLQYLKFHPLITETISKWKN